jgi:hypothetical protein
MQRFKNIWLIAVLLGVTPLWANQEEINNDNSKTDVQVWILDYLNEKDVPTWASDYILSVDKKISNNDAHIFFRRFIADKNTRLDGLLKFVEYLSIAGYPQKVISNNHDQVDIHALDIYKAVYFAVTYTIMDGLPYGPSVAEN